MTKLKYLRPLTPEEAREILQAHLDFEVAGGSRLNEWWRDGKP